MRLNRRKLLKSAALAGAATSLGLTGQASSTSTREGSSRKARIPLAVSSYSYWHFKTEKFPIEKVISEASRLGFDGVEILHRQMESEDISYLNRLKRLAFLEGLSLPMFSIHQDFVDPDPDKRQGAIYHTQHCLDLAHQMSIPVIRLNSGRWGTTRSFDELMKLKSEPPIEGYTDDDAFDWCIDSIEKCIPHAEKRGVMMALENHWGLTTDPKNVIRIVEAVDSPWLGVNMDTGNYASDPYEGMQVLAPYADIVQAKAYYGGGEWYSLDLDYKKIARLLRAEGFKGWVSLEMEGKEDPIVAVEKSYKVLREAFS